MATLYVVGIGPGSEGGMTLEARAALKRADVLCGYGVYLDLVAPLFPEKERFSTPMRGELERCRRALALAQEGRCVALVCSGDAGVYGMASPILELLPAYPGAEVEIVPGVTAALSGAALLLALYNPASHRRRDYLRRAADILLAYRGGDTPCGIAQNIGRAGQAARVLTLCELRDAECDMFSTVFIGSSQTKGIDGRMVTPRGYTR